MLLKNIFCTFFGHKADKTVLAYEIKSHDTFYEVKIYEVSGIPLPRLRLMVLIGDNLEEVNKYIKQAFIIGLEKDDLGGIISETTIYRK